MDDQLEKVIDIIQDGDKVKALADNKKTRNLMAKMGGANGADDLNDLLKSARGLCLFFWFLLLRVSTGIHG